jgi:hypothetical protein
MIVHCSLINIKSMSSARLLALADVELDFDGVLVTVNSIRVEREPDGVSVRLPIDRDGRALITLPDEVKDGISDIVLEAALEVGIVKERVQVTVPAFDSRR